MNAHKTASAGKPARQSGVELLRIAAGMAVVFLHMNYGPGGGGLATTAVGFNRAYLDALEGLCVCAVNVFLLISGAFGGRKRSISLKKLALLLVQTVAFRFVAKLAFSVLSGHFSLPELLFALVPVNYYVILYVALMLLTPFINAGLERLSETGLRRLALTAFLVLSVYATAVDVAGELTGASLAGLSSIGLDGSSQGYTIVNFALMYVLGVWLGRSRAQWERIGTPWLVGAVPVIAALLYGWHRLLPETAWMYSNPLVILEACAVFALFSRLRFSSKVVNAIAPASFTCYLAHGYVLELVKLDGLGALSWPVMALAVALAVAGIYLVSTAVYFVWNIAVKQVFGPEDGRLVLSAE